MQHTPLFTDFETRVGKPCAPWAFGPHICQGKAIISGCYDGLTPRTGHEWVLRDRRHPEITKIELVIILSEPYSVIWGNTHWQQVYHVNPASCHSSGGRSLIIGVSRVCYQEYNVLYTGNLSIWEAEARPWATRWVPGPSGLDNKIPFQNKGRLQCRLEMTIVFCFLEDWEIAGQRWSVSPHDWPRPFSLTMTLLPIKFPCLWGYQEGFLPTSWETGNAKTEEVSGDVETGVGGIYLSNLN